MNGKVIPCFGDTRTIGNLKKNFGYIFDSTVSAGGKPKLIMNTVSGDFEADGVKVTPLPIFHADWTILGYRIGGMAYLTDCSGIPDETMEKLTGLDLLIISALRYRPHPAHFNIEQAVETAEELEPGLTVLTHMGHEIDYDELSAELPEGITPAYDGMEILLEEPGA